MLEADHTFLLLGADRLLDQPLPPGLSVCRGRSEIEQALTGPTKRATWISFARHLTDLLLEEAVDSQANMTGSRLVTLTPPRSESIPALLGLFHSVYGLVDGFQWLRKDELIEVLPRDDAHDRFLGGSVDPKTRTVTLLRGDLKAIVVPFSLFSDSGDRTSPDFTRFRLTDYGRTIAFGRYEASADAILYEVDADYRRRLKKQRQASEQSLGASLMRLRKQKRLERTDFTPISAKEIARIERNQIKRPHARTLDVIAERLGIRREEIEEY